MFLFYLVIGALQVFFDDDDDDDDDSTVKLGQSYIGLFDINCSLCDCGQKLDGQSVWKIQA